MGVRNFYKYVSKKYLLSEISIIDEIMNYKKKNNGKQPIIVVDFCSSLSLFGKSNDILYGGQQNIFLEEADNFCNYFIRNGAKLVFFLDGPIKENKQQEWCSRRNGHYNCDLKMLTKFYEKHSKDGSKKKVSHFLNTYYDNLLIICKQYKEIEIKISFQNECDIDLAEYATSMKALAVLATDTDFLIMPGEWDFWSMADFKINDGMTMTTNKINKKDLQNHLGLSKQQYIIFAILCGNDFLKEEFLQNFYETYCPKWSHDKVGAFVRDKFCSESSKYDIIQQIIRYVGTGNNTAVEDIEAKVKYCWDFFNCIHPTCPDIKPKWLLNNINRTKFTILYELLHATRFFISHRYIDLSYSESVTIEPFSKLALNILQHQLGIVFYNRRNEIIQRTSFLKLKHNTEYELYQFYPIYPDFEIPSISNLTNPKGYVDATKKIELLCWIFGFPSKMFHNKKVVDSKYFVPVLALTYLVKKNQITTKEADALLLSLKNEVQIKYPPRHNPNRRAVFISFVYTNLIYYVFNSLVVVGLDNLIKPGSFDGYAFHKIYEKFTQSPTQEELQKLLQLKSYRVYIEMDKTI